MQEYVSDSGGFYLRDGRWGQGRGGEGRMYGFLVPAPGKLVSVILRSRPFFDALGLPILVAVAPASIKNLKFVN